MKVQLLIDGQPVATLLEYEFVDSETGDVLAKRTRSTVEQFRVWQSTSKKRKRLCAQVPTISVTVATA